MINKISLKYSKEEELNHTRVLLKFPFLMQIQDQNSVRRDQRCALLEEFIRMHISTNIFSKYRHAQLQTNFLESSFRWLHILPPPTPSRNFFFWKKNYLYVYRSASPRSHAILPVVGSGRRRRRKTRGMPGTRKEQGFSRRIPVAHTERQNLIRLALKQPAKKGINAIPISRTD